MLVFQRVISNGCRRTKNLSSSQPSELNAKISKRCKVPEKTTSHDCFVVLLKKRDVLFKKTFFVWLVKLCCIWTIVTIRELPECKSVNHCIIVSNTGHLKITLRQLSWQFCTAELLNTMYISTSILMTIIYFSIWLVAQHHRTNVLWRSNVGQLNLVLKFNFLTAMSD